MLKQRVLAAAVFAPALVGVVFYGGLALDITLLALVALMLGEFCRLAGMGLTSPMGLATLALGAATAAITLGLAPAWCAAGLAPALAVLPVLAALWDGPPWPARLAQVGLATWGAVWCGALLPHLALVRRLESGGQAAALMVVGAVWAADTGAYFAGHRFGRRKLAPLASPGKTLEGAVGGVAAAVFAALALNAWLGEGGAYPSGWRLPASLGVLCAVIGPVGDIAESVVKRSVGAKDSSHLIPGHGGVLDRFDALMFAAPAAYAWLRWQA